jgi:two-component system sensor histidine kinase ChiS
MNEGRPRVLIVEDNADLLAILAELLGQEYEVATALRGEDGVTLAQSLQPDVVIMDLQLPGMDGIEAGLCIKQAVPNVRILVLTALAGPGDPEAILGSGCCDAYMPKPASLDAIRNTVADMLGSGTRV